MVPLRDGTRLATDLFFPAGDGPAPAVLGRTPYGKNMPQYAKLVEAWNRRGYAFAVQDVRGRGDSDGEFTPYVNEGLDAHDTIEWIAEQPWSDGNVIIMGGSYGGRSCWLTALTRPPHLRAMIPLVAPSDPFVEFPTSGETPMMICWFRLVDGRVVQNVEGVDWMRIYEHLPLETMDEAAGFSSPHWREAISHTILDEHFDPVRYQNRYHEIDIPALHISGWYDDEQVGTPMNFAAMTSGGANEETRAAQHMVMGPWGHAVNTLQQLGEVDFGSEALIDLEGYEADFADRVLGRGTPSEQTPVRIFVMGTNTWRDEQEWPLARTRFTDYFLHSDGRANSRLGDGGLNTEQAGGDEPQDVYEYDPARPVPFITDQKSNQIGGPDDYSAVELRGDVLCYTSEPLAEPLEVTGPVRLRLFASSSAVDTDFTAKLVDVHPTGFCQRLCDGVVRARYRRGHEKAEFMEPGLVYEFDIEMWNTAQVFLPGHRIRLEVSSSAFPKYDRSLNTDEDIATATRMETAENRVWHDAEHPSRLILPIIPANA
jgi:putative CocE/NonD family hydrolase